MQLKHNIIFNNGIAVLIFPDHLDAMCAFNTMQLHKRKERDFFGKMATVKPQRKRIAIDKRTSAEKFYQTRTSMIYNEKRAGS